MLGRSPSKTPESYPKVWGRERTAPKVWFGLDRVIIEYIEETKEVQKDIPSCNGMLHQVTQNRDEHMTRIGSS